MLNEAELISICVHMDDFWVKELYREVGKVKLIVPDASGVHNDGRTQERRNDHTLD